LDIAMPSSLYSPDIMADALMVKTVNAGEILQQLAGAKVQ